MAFYNNAMKYAAKRFELLQSDGYKIYTKEEFETYRDWEMKKVGSRCIRLLLTHKYAQ